MAFFRKSKKESGKDMMHIEERASLASQSTNITVSAKSIEKEGIQLQGSIVEKDRLMSEQGPLINAKLSLRAGSIIASEEDIESHSFSSKKSVLKENNEKVVEIAKIA
jgi:hypothetical protein